MPLWKGRKHSTHSSRNKTAFYPAKLSSAQFLHLPRPLPLMGCLFLEITWTPFSLLSGLITSYPELLRKVILLIWLSPLSSLTLPMNVWSSLLCLRVQSCPLRQVLYPHICVPLESDRFSTAWIIGSKQIILSVFPTVLPSSHLFPSQPAQPLDPDEKDLQGTLPWPHSSFWGEKLEEPRGQGDVPTVSTGPAVQTSSG